MRATLTKNVLALAAELFKTNPKPIELPRLVQARNAFIFRYAVCSYVSILMRIESGGAGRTKLDRLRNDDVIDVNFSAFATYFDGLLTADRRSAKIYAGAQFLLREVFAMPPLWLRLFLWRKRLSV